MYVYLYHCATQQILSHSNIVRFFGHRREDPTVYLFLEYCTGGELFDRIGEKAFSCSPAASEHNTHSIKLYLYSPFHAKQQDKLLNNRRQHNSKVKLQ